MPGRSSARSLKTLAEALRTDVELVREHTRIGEAALRWEWSRSRRGAAPARRGACGGEGMACIPTAIRTRTDAPAGVSRGVSAPARGNGADAGHAGAAAVATRIVRRHRVELPGVARVQMDKAEHAENLSARAGGAR